MKKESKRSNFFNILPDLTAAFNLASHLHRFRKCYSTTTALQDVVDYIIAGLNQKQPIDSTVLVAIDLACAFNTVKPF